MSEDAGVCGLLAIDKPAGMTSHDVVARVRRTLGKRRVGHAGTLDPLATGLLPCLVGPATRLVRFLHRWPKSYVGVIALGEETATGDREQLSGSAARPPVPPAAVLEQACRRLSGRYWQTPPVYSAKKLGGIAAHRLARRGYAPALAPVLVTVHRLRLVPGRDGRLAFAARVSSGTYLRALARDLGRLLGTGAHLEQLRRTAVGPVRVREAISPSAERAAMLAALQPLERIPLQLAAVQLEERQEAAFRCGRVVELAADRLRPDIELPAEVRVLGSSRLAGIGDLDLDRRLRPRVVLPVGSPAGSPVAS
ncbi:MAG: tRNA pseudouridine(55) synthase TruB [Acidobacteriota bacterium]|nr:MAG: tRNA pseudouridine(55) synthase TruB [Acidobacteriota bacterium]